MQVIAMQVGIHHNDWDVGDRAEIHEFEAFVGEEAGIEELNQVLRYAYQ